MYVYNTFTASVVVCTVYTVYTGNCRMCEKATAGHLVIVVEMYDERLVPVDVDVPDRRRADTYHSQAVPLQIQFGYEFLVGLV